MAPKDNKKKTALQTVLYLLQTDFCPGANVYVYWLKEPVGWFCVGFLCSLLVGAFVSPIGWSIAAGIAVVLLLGLGFPWVATRVLRCELGCDTSEMHEGDQAYLILKVRNPMPLPVMGLVIENYFQIPTGDQNDETLVEQSECGLARVPAFSSAEYRLPIRPRYRGEYPNGNPAIACGFPFGIYTARKPVPTKQRVLVRPFVLPLMGDCEFSGSKLAEVGDGNRPTHHGDFLGVRQFRRGDSLRSIHWVQSARLDELVVCERGGPQKSTLTISLSTARCHGSAREARDNLAWRVRLAASLVDLLASRHVPFSLTIDGHKSSLPLGSRAAAAGLNALAKVPLDSLDANTQPAGTAPNSTTDKINRGFAIELAASGENAASPDHVALRVALQDEQANAKHGPSTTIDLREDIVWQLEELLQEVSLENAAA